MINKLETPKDFEILFLSLNEQLYRYILVRCNYSNEVAEDITQDTFLKAWEKRNTFDPKKSTLKNWIYIIARNCVIDYYRKNKFTRSDYNSLEDIIKDNSMSNEDTAALDLILRELENFDDKEKEIITLRYINDLSISDISQIIGKKNNATKVAIHRAIKKLKEIINKNDR